MGTVAGGVISGSAAAALTAAPGEVYIGFLMLICTGEINAEDLKITEGKELISKMFKDKLNIKRNRNGEPEEQ